MQAGFRVADGYAVNLFASEEQFPELRAPVQIAFDERGRLWAWAGLDSPVPGRVSAGKNGPGSPPRSLITRPTSPW
jgi:hypothetical protein